MHSGESHLRCAGSAFPTGVPSTALYPNARALTISEPVSFHLTPLFSPTVHRWLDETVRKTREWADSVSPLMLHLDAADVQALAVDSVSNPFAYNVARDRLKKRRHMRELQLMSV